MTASNSSEVPRLRCLLFAPGDNAAVLAKLPRSAPDGAVIDLEDAVAVDDKAAARRIAVDIAPSLASEVAVFVRVNPADSIFFTDDLGALSRALTGVVVPKLESGAGVRAVRAALDGVGLGDLALVAGIETARGVHQIDEILRSGGVDAAYFGAEDFIADMGGVRTDSNHEVAYARGRCALAARIANVPLLDQVVADYADEVRFLREATEARNMGYAGKLCIHPAQVALAHRAFRPTAEEIDRATRLVAAFEAAGVGVMSFEGEMVDEPVVARARAVLAAAE